jgi:mannan endo-1,4-beta-mannosidase
MSNCSWLCLLIALLTIPAAFAEPESMVRIQNGLFERNGKPYIFVGANFWQGMNLGSKGPGGDRPRLIRELNRLQNAGIKNLRIVALTEGPDTSPYRVTPSNQTSPGKFDETLLEGLDFLLVEMAKRDLTAVMCLGNFWPWSGGFAQYVSWAESSAIPYPPPHPGGSWSGFQEYSSRFYTLPKARALHAEAVRRIVARVNTITHIPYSKDPTILSWQLANEPRGGKYRKDFLDWLGTTARLIKQIDSLHLVTTGSEGDTLNPADAGNDFVQDHSVAGIDYATLHVWVENWGVYDPKQPATIRKSMSLMSQMIQSHTERAARMKKPLVLEEFGLARDQRSMDPRSTTLNRDRYFAHTFAEVARIRSRTGFLTGVAFWAWSGESRPAMPGGLWKQGQPLLGDPPHEEQGWYGVYDTDTSTISVIQRALRD